jgi:hypothetical protein
MIFNFQLFHNNLIIRYLYQKTVMPAVSPARINKFRLRIKLEFPENGQKIKQYKFIISQFALFGSLITHSQYALRI